MINTENPDFQNSPSSPARARFPYERADGAAPPVVSVITPYYDTDAVFLETAGSLFEQSFQDWEWVIVDDGSTDASAIAQLAAVEKRDARIKVIHQPNRGPAAARNAGFRASTGRYICLLDSDDLLEPTFIEKCVWFLESQPQFGFCNAWSVSFGYEEFLWPAGFERGKEHLQKNIGPNFSVIRRAAFVAAGGFDESIRVGHEDWDFWLALAQAGYWGHTLPEYLGWYRKRKVGRQQQVRSTGSLHDDFTALIAKKYAGLESNFPAPQLAGQQPYEPIPTSLPFSNRLAQPNNNRRILFLLPWMVTGGADKVNLDWIEGLVKSGHQVSICATLQSHNEWLHNFARLTPDIFVLPNFLRLADFPRFLVYFIQSRQIGAVVVAGSTLGYQLLPYLRTHCPGVVFLDVSHAEEQHWLSGGHPRFGVGYQDMLDLNVVTTGQLREAMIARGGDPARIEVCHTGIDLDLLERSAQQKAQARSALDLPAGVPTIVYAGRLCEQKRPQLFAAILRELARRTISFRALVVGDGELRPQLESSIREYGLESSVRLLGTVDHARWLEILSAADIFLLPSQYEGISVALLEAMGMKVVPVVAAVGGQSEVMSPECGFLVPHGAEEISAYADAIALLVQHPERRAAMAQAGRERVLREFSHEQSLRRLLGLFDHAEMLARAQPRQAAAPGFARELATLAVEYTRLSGVAHSLWTERPQTIAAMKSASSAPPMGLLRQLAARLSVTRPGAFLLRSQRLRASGRWLLRRLEAMQQR